MKLFGENTKYISVSYDPDLRWFMTQVYACVAGGLAVCFLGSQMHINGWLQAGWPWLLLEIFFLFATFIYQVYKKLIPLPSQPREILHYALLLGFAFSLGVNLGRTIEYAIGLSKLGGTVAVSHQLVTEALFLTTLIFGIFTVVGIFVTPGIFYFALVLCCVGSFVMSLNFWLTLFGLTSLATFDLIYIQFGLVVSAFYIIVDTAIILEKAKTGERNVVTSALVLLTDFIQVFVRVLLILANSKRNNSSSSSSLPVFYNDEL